MWTSVLELCKKWGAGFILLSTSRVYSIAALQAIPLRENASRFDPDPDAADGGVGWSGAGLAECFPTTPPISLYGNTKLCSEWLALEYGAAFGFPVWINRCGVLAGAGQFGKADQGIFSYWIHSWKAGRPLRYIGFGGTGKQVRDCLHPRDLVPAVMKQLDSPPSTGTNPASQIFNFSGGRESSMSLCELSAWCRERFGPSESESSLRSVVSETRPYDIPWIVLDPARSRDHWNWCPAMSRDAVLEEIARHSEANPQWQDLCDPRKRN